MGNLRFIFVLFCCFGAANAQVRDLFAEFEEALSSSSIELLSSSSVKPAVSSSSVPASSSAALPVSSSEIAIVSSSSAVPAISSSSAITPVSSSLPDVSSSSAIPADSSGLSSSGAVLPADSLNVPDSSAVETLPDSSAIPVALSSSSENPAAVTAPSSSSQITLSSSSISRRDLLGPVKVSRVHGIDEMKGRYKSPKKALFMSLLVPGSGQLYVGGSKFNYARGGIYLALEASLWGGWFYYSVHKYNKQVSRYEKFAKRNFSAGWYEKKMHDLYYQLDDSDAENRFTERYLSERESYCKAIYGAATTSNCYNKNTTFENDRNHTDRFDTVSLGKTLHNMSFSDPGLYYQIIAGGSYTLGWMDVTDETTVPGLGLSGSETVTLGKSENQKTYRKMRDKANDYAGMQAWFFGGLILNHLVSAIDAAFTANAHNKELYEEDLSWYDRLNFRSDFTVIDGVSASIQALWSF